MRQIILFFILLWGPSFCATAQVADATAANPVLSPFQMLSQYDSLEVWLEMEVKKVRRERNPEVWHPATFKIQKGGATLREFAVQVQPRGNNRRATCDMPPLKIRFPLDSQLPDSLRETYTLKMVAPCKLGANLEALVLKECLLYELYGLLTPESFKTKIASVTLKDRYKKNAPAPVFCFFIETEAELADRLHYKTIKPKVMSPRGLDAAAFDRVCVFQYMIGNTDWTTYNRHNMRLLISNESAVIAIPYDFDYAGAVDAPYAVPQEGAPIESVQQRYFFGLCRPEGEYQRTFDLFLSKKAAILQRCDDFPYLPKNARQDLKKFVASFFPILENPRSARREILEHCDNFKKE